MGSGRSQRLAGGQAQIAARHFDLVIADGDGFDVSAKWWEREIYLRALFIQPQGDDRELPLMLLPLCVVLIRPFHVWEWQAAMAELLQRKMVSDDPS